MSPSWNRNVSAHTGTKYRNKTRTISTTLRWRHDWLSATKHCLSVSVRRYWLLVLLLLYPPPLFQLVDFSSCYVPFFSLNVETRNHAAPCLTARSTALTSACLFPRTDTTWFTFSLGKCNAYSAIRPFSRTGGLTGVRHFPIECHSIIIGCQMVHGYGGRVTTVKWRDPLLSSDYLMNLLLAVLFASSVWLDGNRAV